jgi:signal transduction histidine kinase
MVSPDDNLERVSLQKIRNITGYLLIVGFSVCVVYVALFYYMHIFFLCYVGISIMILVIISRIAWAKGYINYARFSLVILGNALIFTLCGSLGRAGGANLLYIPMFCAVLVLFNTKDLFLLMLMSCLSATCLIMLEIYNYAIFSIHTPPEEFLYVTRVFSSVISLGVAISCIYSLQQAGNNAEKTLEHAREEIKKQSLELESKNKELEQFVYIASHDLQEPVRTVSSLADFLSNDYEDKLDDSAKQSFDFIKEATARMSELIKGLLDYSRLGMYPEVKLTDINDLINSVLDDLGSSVRESGAKIHVGSLPVLNVYATELRLLFQNLISNAIKFRKKGIPPEISISANKGDGEWQFSVKDNGLGIETKYKEKIFEIFQRIHKRNEYEGAGIGLAHVKKIVNLHNGKIWLDSVPGIGSTFYFTLNSKL